MVKVNIAEVKAKLSEFLEIAAGGETVLICKHNRPVAELRAVQAVRTEPRPLGGAAGQFEVPAAFFDPLPEDLLAGFMGTTADLPVRAAEQPATYGSIKQPAADRQKRAARTSRHRARR